MQKKFFALSLLASLSLGLSSCAGLQVPDSPICVEIDPSRANCVKIVSGESFDIDETHPFEGKTYWEIRPTVVLVPASTWIELNKFITLLCKKTNQCQKSITSWDKSIEIIDNQLKKKGN